MRPERHWRGRKGVILLGLLVRSSLTLVIMTSLVIYFGDTVLSCCLQEKLISLNGKSLSRPTRLSANHCIKTNFEMLYLLGNELAESQLATRVTYFSLHRLR